MRIQYIIPLLVYELRYIWCYLRIKLGLHRLLLSCQMEVYIYLANIDYFKIAPAVNAFSICSFPNIYTIMVGKLVIIIAAPI